MRCISTFLWPGITMACQKKAQTKHFSLLEIKTLANGETEPLVEKWDSETAVDCIKALIHHSSGVTEYQVRETGGIFAVWKCHPTRDLFFSAKQETTSLHWKNTPCFVILSVRDLQIFFLHCLAFEEKWALIKILILESYNGAIFLTLP